MKKVLCVLNQVSYSGAEVMIKNAASDLRALGFEWEVLSTGENPGSYVKELASENVRVHHLPLRRNPVFFWKFSRLLRREHYDVLHIHCERASFWYALVGWLSGVPKIVRSYHTVFHFTGILRLTRAMQRWIASRFLGVINHAVGPSVQRCEWETFRNSADIILNWADESVFSEISSDERTHARKSLQISQESFVITSVGMCREAKNHEHILYAMQNICLAKNDFYYLHVGAGSTLSREQDLAKKIGVDERVLFVGQCPSNKVREIYAACDVVVMPSDYEGLPMVIMEAMKCGRPVIAYDAPGLRDFNHEQQGGIWIPPSKDALAEALRTFLDSPELLRRKSAEAVELANRTFSKDKSLQALTQLYKGENY